MKEHYPVEHKDVNPLKNIERFLESNQFLQIVSRSAEFAENMKCNLHISFNRINNEFVWTNKTYNPKAKNHYAKGSILNVNIHPFEHPNIVPLPYEIDDIVHSDTLIYGFLSTGSKDDKRIGSLVLLNKQDKSNNLRMLEAQRLQDEFDKYDTFGESLDAISANPFNIKSTVIDVVENGHEIFKYGSPDARDKLSKLIIPNNK